RKRIGVNRQGTAMQGNVACTRQATDGLAEAVEVEGGVVVDGDRAGGGQRIVRAELHRAGVADVRGARVGVGAAQRQRAAADLDQGAAAAGNPAARGGRTVFATEGELLAARVERPGAFDRAGRGAGAGQIAEDDLAAGVGDEARLPATAC